MNSPRVWLTSDDGSVEIVSLTNETLPAALDLLCEAFYPHESVCTAVGVSKNQEAMQELNTLAANAAKDGVSLVAREKTTGVIVGFAFNKLQSKSQGGDFFENFAANCQQSASKGVIDFMAEVDARCDLFSLLNVNCIFEIMFLATHSDYRGKQISTKLCEASIQVATALNYGQNVKVALDGGCGLKLDPIPEAVSAIFTSFITQRIGQKLGFTRGLVVSYNDLVFEGCKYSSRVDPKSRYTTVEYKRLGL